MVSTSSVLRRCSTGPVTWITSSSRRVWESLAASALSSGAEDALGDALAVAEVDEDHAAVVADGVDPADEGGGLADVSGRSSLQ